MLWLVQRHSRTGKRQLGLLVSAALKNGCRIVDATPPSRCCSRRTGSAAGGCSDERWARVVEARTERNALRPKRVGAPQRGARGSHRRQGGPGVGAEVVLTVDGEWPRTRLFRRSELGDALTGARLRRRIKHKLKITAVRKTVARAFMPSIANLIGDDILCLHSAVCARDVVSALVRMGRLWAGERRRDAEPCLARCIYLHEAAIYVKAVPGIGAEIVLTVDGELPKTRLFRSHEQAELVGAIADTRAIFEGKRWADWPLTTRETAARDFR